MMDIWHASIVSVTGLSSPSNAARQNKAVCGPCGFEEALTSFPCAPTGLPCWGSRPDSCVLRLQTHCCIPT